MKLIHFFDDIYVNPQQVNAVAVTGEEVTKSLRVLVEVGNTYHTAGKFETIAQARAFVDEFLEKLAEAE